MKLFRNIMNFIHFIDEPGTGGSPKPAVDPETGAHSDPGNDAAKIAEEQAAVAAAKDAEAARIEALKKEAEDSKTKPIGAVQKASFMHHAKPAAVNKSSNVTMGRYAPVVAPDVMEDYDTLDPVKKKESIAHDTFYKVESTILIETTRSTQQGENFVVGEPSESGIYSKINQTPKKLFTGMTHFYDFDSPLQRSSGLDFLIKPAAVVISGDIVYGSHDVAKGFNPGAIVYNRQNAGAFLNYSFNLVKKSTYLIRGIKLPPRGCDLRIDTGLAYHTEVNLGGNAVDVTHESLYIVDSENHESLFDVIELTPYLEDIYSATAEVIQAATCVESRHSIGEAEAIASSLSEKINSLKLEALEIQNSFKYQEFAPAQGRSSILTYRGDRAISCQNDIVSWFKHLQDVESSEVMAVMPLVATMDVRSAYKFWHALQGQNVEKPFITNIFLADEAQNVLPGLSQVASNFGSPAKYNTPAKMLYTIREMWKEIESVIGMYSNNSQFANFFSTVSAPFIAIEEILSSQNWGRLDDEDEIPTDASILAPDHLNLILNFDPNDFVSLEYNASGHFVRFSPRCYLRNLVSTQVVGNTAQYENLYHMPTWIDSIIRAINDPQFMAKTMSIGNAGRLDDAGGIFAYNGYSSSLIIDRLGFSWAWFFIGRALKEKHRLSTSIELLNSSVQLRYRAVINRFLKDEIISDRNKLLSTLIDRFINTPEFRINDNFDLNANQIRHLTAIKKEEYRLHDAGNLVANYHFNIADWAALGADNEAYADFRYFFRLADFTEINSQDMAGICMDSTLSHKVNSASDLFALSKVTHNDTCDPDHQPTITDIQVTLAAAGSPFNLIGFWGQLADLDLFKLKISQMGDDGDSVVAGYDFLPVNSYYKFDRWAFVKNCDFLAEVQTSCETDSLRYATQPYYQTNHIIGRPNEAKLLRRYLLQVDDGTNTQNIVSHAPWYQSVKHDSYNGDNTTVLLWATPEAGILSVDKKSFSEGDLDDLLYDIAFKPEDEEELTNTRFVSYKNLLYRRMTTPSLYGYKRTLSPSIGLKFYGLRNGNTGDTNAYLAATPNVGSRKGVSMAHGHADELEDFADGWNAIMYPYLAEVSHIYLGSYLLTNPALYQNFVNDPGLHNRMFMNFFYNVVNNDALGNTAVLADENFATWLYFNRVRNLPFTPYTWYTSRNVFPVLGQTIAASNRTSIGARVATSTLSDLKKRMNYFEYYFKTPIAKMIPVNNIRVDVKNVANSVGEAFVFTDLMSCLNPKFSILRNFDDERQVYLGKPLYFTDVQKIWSLYGVTNDNISATYYQKDSNSSK